MDTYQENEGRLWASLGSLESSKDVKKIERVRLSGDRYTLPETMSSFETAENLS